MDSTAILQEIYSLVERLDKLIPLWAKSKADKNYCDEMKQVTLNMEKAKSNAKTNAKREEEAFISEAYTKYLWKTFEIDCNYYSLDGQKGLLEKKLDAMRSALSYEKSITSKTI
jgi:hypothetical protein